MAKLTKKEYSRVTEGKHRIEQWQQDKAAERKRKGIE